MAPASLPARTCIGTSGITHIGMILWGPLQDVVLEVLAHAAPFVPLVVKPPLPHSVVPEDLTAEQQQLFQLASSAGPGAAAPVDGTEAAAPAGLGAAAQ